MKLNHHRVGQGPALVLIHGIGSHWQVWAPVLDRLASEREVIALDLPGFGESPALPAGTRPTLEALSDAVVAFLSELGIERPHVAGNSLGGWLALELARRGLPASATALSPGGFWNRREAAYSRASLRATIRGARLMSPVAHVVAATPVGRTMLFAQVMARPWRMPAQEAVSALRALAGANVFEETLELLTSDRFSDGAGITIPTTIAWGERDWLLIPRQAHRAARAVPRARSITLHGCGHVPTWDDPEQVARVLLDGSSGA